MRIKPQASGVIKARSPKKPNIVNAEKFSKLSQKQRAMQKTALFIK